MLMYLWAGLAFGLFVYLWLRARRKQKETREKIEAQPPVACPGCGAPSAYCACWPQHGAPA